MSPQVLSSSFRDPSGFVFERDGILYRQVNEPYRPHFALLMSSGLYRSLTEARILVAHREVDPGLAATPGAFKVLAPDLVEFISYPYEWCFGQLKAAALLTLQIQKMALDHGMSLRDASAYNVQFRAGRPVLIDTLSFEELPQGQPWVAYRQFCQQFLAPLALMSYRDVRLGLLGRIHVDGVPLDLARTLLPRRARLRPGIFLHVFAHGKRQSREERGGRVDEPRLADEPRPVGQSRPAKTFSPRAFRGLIDSLESAVRGLEWTPRPSVWTDYSGGGHTYSSDAVQHKRHLVAGYLEQARPATVWDLGGNTGSYSRIAAGRGISAVCFDSDFGAVEENYRQVVRDGDTNVLPLVMDLTNPSPGLGWGNRERSTLADRGPADMALALALVHHLAIGNNVPLDRVAAVLRPLCSSLAIEFVPKGDPQVQKMLETRADVFADYTVEGFERAFEAAFAIERKDPIRGSKRVLYLMRGR